LQQEKEIEEQQIVQQATYARRQQGHQRLLLRGQEEIGKNIDRL
jgi:hypothetical protein